MKALTCTTTLEISQWNLILQQHSIYQNGILPDVFSFTTTVEILGIGVLCRMNDFDLNNLSLVASGCCKVQEQGREVWPLYR
jgi:hypothetical protein